MISKLFQRFWPVSKQSTSKHPHFHDCSWFGDALPRCWSWLRSHWIGWIDQGVSKNAFFLFFFVFFSATQPPMWGYVIGGFFYQWQTVFDVTDVRCADCWCTPCRNVGDVADTLGGWHATCYVRSNTRVTCRPQALGKLRDVGPKCCLIILRWNLPKTTTPMKFHQQFVKNIIFWCPDHRMDSEKVGK